jgi:glucose-6-phosphate isomerase
MVLGNNATGVIKMNGLAFSFKDALTPEKDMKEAETKLGEEIHRMVKASKSGYDDERGSINLPLDYIAEEKVTALVEQKRELEPKYMIVIGIGGSNLGTMAVQEAVLGRLFNLSDSKMRILYAETVDSDEIKKITSIAKTALEERENIILNVVSKSGTTTETIALFEIFLNLLKRYRGDHKEFVVVTTDRNSPLWDLAQKKKYSLLEVPKKVGGRYSVFSPVGLFPLGLLGIDIHGFMEGAKSQREMCLMENLRENPAASGAAHMNAHYKNGKNIHDLFLFAKDLEVVGKWYRQLMGESLGKEHDKNGNQVFTGITPTTSVGSTDLHSVAQLYLGGPYDKFTTFVTVRNTNDIVSVPPIPEFAELVPNIQDKNLKEIMDAIEEGVKAAYRKNKRPFMEIVLPHKKEKSMGQLLQFMMMEMMYLGALLNVNPFDQPNVERYKTETRRVLKGM